MHFKNLYVVQLLFVSLSILPFVFGGHAYSRLKESGSESEKGSIRSTSSSSPNKAYISFEPLKPDEEKFEDDERIFTLWWSESYEKGVQHSLTTCESISMAKWEEKALLRLNKVFDPVDIAMSFLRADIREVMRAEKKRGIPKEKREFKAQGNKLKRDLVSWKENSIILVDSKAPILFKHFLKDYFSNIHKFPHFTNPENLEEIYRFTTEEYRFPGSVTIKVFDKRITFQFPFISANTFIEEYNLKDNLKFVNEFYKLQKELEKSCLKALKLLFKKALLQHCEERGLKSQQN